MQGFGSGRAPNFDNKLHRGHIPGRIRKDGAAVVRFEMPFAVWCHHCRPYAIIGQGVRFNAEKKKVGYYYSTPIWSFRMRHPACGQYLEIRTDPKNTAYVVTEGGKARDYGDTQDRVREGDGGIPILTTAEREARREDAFAALEGRMEEKAQVHDNIKRIDELYRAKERDWDDPWTANRRMRDTFRRERKLRKRDEEATEALKARLGTDIDILPENEEDSKRAKLQSYGKHETGDQVGAEGKALFERRVPAPNSRKTFVMKERPQDALRRKLLSNTRAAINPFSKKMGF